MTDSERTAKTLTKREHTPAVQSMVHRKCFRLGSGAAVLYRGSRTTSHYAGSTRWLILGAIMLALVDASRGANSQHGSDTPLKSTEIIHEKSGPLLVSGDESLGERRNTNPKGQTFLVEEHAPMVNELKKRVSAIMTVLGACACLSCLILMNPVYHSSARGTDQQGPVWDPDGDVPFRAWLHELQLWLAITQSRMRPTAQAVAIRLGLRGLARTFALQIPDTVIANGIRINGLELDPVTSIVSLLGNRFAQPGTGHVIAPGNAVFEFQARPNEPIDQLLARWDLAREEAASTGEELGNVYHIATHLMRTLGLNAEQITVLLEPMDGRLPTTMQQYNELVERIRTMGHATEAISMQSRRTTRRRPSMTRTDSTSQTHHTDLQHNTTQDDTDNGDGWQQEHSQDDPHFDHNDSNGQAEQASQVTATPPGSVHAHSEIDGSEDTGTDTESDCGEKELQIAEPDHDDPTFRETQCPPSAKNKARKKSFRRKGKGRRPWHFSGRDNGQYKSRTRQRQEFPRGKGSYSRTSQNVDHDDNPSQIWMI